MKKHDTLAMYLGIYVALMLLLVVTVWVAFQEFAPFNATIALLVAVVKTVLVLAYFMHVRRSGWFIWVCALSGFFFIAILVGITFSDYYTRL